MNKLYTGVLLVLAVAAASCGSKQIAIEKIQTRKALDSIIALLPPSQVKVDSVPIRTLYIKLEGNFSYYGQPVKELAVETKDERLSRFSFDTEKGAADVLQQLEEANGTGYKEFSEPFLSWDNVEQKIQFSVREFEGDLLSLSNKEKASLLMFFNNPVHNRITNIYKELQPKESTNNYRLDIDNSECGYRIYVNGFLAVDHAGSRTLGVEADINPYLVKGKAQNITVELLPGNDFDGHPRSRLHLESVVHVTLKRWSHASIFSPVVLDFRTPNVDSIVREDAHSSRYIRASKFYGQLSAKVEHPFEIAPVPYELPCYKTANTDIRQVPDAKEKLLAHYRKLRDAYLQKDPQQLDSLLYPLKQNTEMAAFHLLPTDGQALWTKILKDAGEASGVKLEEQVVLWTTPDGHFARLLPAAKTGNPAFYLDYGDHLLPLDYYMSINKNGEVQFALD